MEDLKTNYQDDVLDTDENTTRVFDIVDSNNQVVEADVHFVDKSVYLQNGDPFGSQDINDTNGAINEANANLMLKGVISATPRWLRFDPNNKKGLVIKKGTSIKKSNDKVVTFTADTQIDLSGDISENGVEYLLYLNDDNTFSVSKTPLGTGVEIGRFHTLCVSVGTITMIAPAPKSSGYSVGDYYLIKGYDSSTDPDFYTFYRKQISAITTGTYYDVVTVPHPLSGFTAGDIIPESVFCETFKPKAMFKDAMVYDVDTDIVVDVYLQSGTGVNTRSEYNKVHTVSRQQYNHSDDFRAVGKRLLKDYEFSSIALGSNEKTNIQGSADKTNVGGHVDTASRRMISAIGCEECCGYLWQWLDEIAPVGGSGWANGDGQGSFGQNYGDPYCLIAGGAWYNSADCGSRSRDADCVRSYVHSALGGRGSSVVVRN